MKFHFAFEPLLSLRNSLEASAWTALQTAWAQLSAVRQQRDKRVRQMIQERADRSNALRSGVFGAEVHISELVLHDSSKAVAALEAEINRAEQNVMLRQQEYLCARMEREKLDTLRERRYKKFMLEQERRERAMIDELTAMRQRFLAQN